MILRLVSNSTYPMSYLMMVGSVSFGLWLAITLCIEANVLSPDSKWNLWIARALYQQKEYRRCVVCLEQCPKRESWYYLTNNCHCSLLLAKCFFHLGEFDKALSYLQDIDVFVLSFHQSRMKRLWMPHSSSWWEMCFRNWAIRILQKQLTFLVIKRILFFYLSVILFMKWV